jgi:putative peptide zinc metalloprotease protein
LDGRHTLRDLTLDYWAEYKLLAPQIVAEIVAGLAGADFVEAPGLDRIVAGQLTRHTAGERALLLAQRVLERRVVLAHPDEFLTRLYRGGGYLLYRPIGVVVLAVVALAGLIAFLTGAAGAAKPLDVGGLIVVALVLPGARFLSLVLHELGHALATKAAGRRVGGVGLGWYWFNPIAYVETTDVWLAGRRARIGVSLAGLFNDLVLGGLAALSTRAVTKPLVAALLWQFALLSYGAALINLCPALKFDGYYALADVLDRPQLRQRAFGWLGREFGTALRTPGGLDGHWVDLAFGLGALAYLFLMVCATFLADRVFGERWMSGVMPETIGLALTMGLAATFAGLIGLAVLSEIRGLSARAPSAGGVGR